MTSSDMIQKPTEYAHEDNRVTRVPVQASMGDGARLHGYLYRRIPGAEVRGKKFNPLTIPLLCLPTELGNTRQLHRFALSLGFQESCHNKIYTLDLRGRGRSEDAGVSSSNLTTDADDLISFCDAHNLHHIDMVVSGYSLISVFNAMTRRPSLVRRLILNDAAPEFDAVGIARRTALMQRTDKPTNWQECAEQLRDLKAEEFPQFSDQDWLDMAEQNFRLEEGGPVPDIAKVRGQGQFTPVALLVLPVVYKGYVRGQQRQAHFSDAGTEQFHNGGTRLHVLAKPHALDVDHSVERCPDLGIRQVDFSLPQAVPGRLDAGFRLRNGGFHHHHLDLRQRQLGTGKGGLCIRERNLVIDRIDTQ